LFNEVRARLAAADLVVCNLEEPLTDWPHQTPHKNSSAVAAGRDFILRATSAVAARALAAAGIRVAGLANNHTMDYTERGLFDTLDKLDSAAILPVGGGKNIDAAERLQIVEVRGRRIGFLAFSDVVPRYYWAEENRPGIASAKDVPRLQRIIAGARPHAETLVVIFHWGKQLARQPTRRQWELARAAQRAGADLILGAHPHVLQGIGCVGRVPVVFSAGNFVFSSRRGVARRSAIFEIEFQEAHAASVRVVPVQLDEQGAPRLAEGAAAREILDEMSRFSSRLEAGFAEDTASCPGLSPTKRKSKKAVRTR